MAIKLFNQSSTGFFPKLALSVGALALLSTVLTYLEFGKEELLVSNSEENSIEMDNAQFLI